MVPMNGVLRYNRDEECFLCWEPQNFIFFADDVALLALPVCDLWHALGQLATECEATSKSEVMVFCQKWVYSPKSDFCPLDR